MIATLLLALANIAPDNENPVAGHFDYAATTHGSLLMHYITEWLNKFPLVSTLLILIFLDILMGTGAAFVGQKLSSSVSFKGMVKKVTMLLFVGATAAIEPLCGLPLAKLSSLYFIWTEMISIVEACAALGVPLPPQLKAALIKLRDNDAALVGGLAPQVPPSPVVINARAVSVRSPAGQTQAITLPPDSASTVAMDANTAAVDRNTAARTAS